MTKSELIELLAAKQTHLMHKDVELAVKLVLDQISNALARDERVEIRGFGSFALHHRPARVGRNPKTGEPVHIPPKRVPHFKPGKEMRERVNAAAAGLPLPPMSEHDDDGDDDESLE
ncbi:integration host factor subunit beta [Solimonas aquatica]|uniref:Integration host factor subunit beta n=1 Tax=Solimonas aquatica TaxID=489703 RepID=A0A1H8ZWK1_9GAMM|nr:integration host factor subunit beta [Solimonas aquatica]SEP68830.1 integration host factor subunit beta [Solimonas aquatica]